MIVGAIQTYQEASRIERAITSLWESGCDEVFVLDGAWHHPDGSTFGGGPVYSDDGTVDIAAGAGATVCMWAGAGGDAAKQTDLIRLCAGAGDTVVKIDADETLHGRLRDVAVDAMIMLHNQGPNDLPGVRGTWPRGDDADRPIPLLRVFGWRLGLVCERPGRWMSPAGPIEPYLLPKIAAAVDSIPGLAGDDPLAVAYRQLSEREDDVDPCALALLPILDGVRIVHHRDDSKADAKRAYYEAVAS